MTDRRPHKQPDASPAVGDEEAAFARWVERQLHALYDPILDEKVPERLRRAFDEAAASVREGERDSTGLDSDAGSVDDTNNREACDEDGERSDRD